MSRPQRPQWLTHGLGDDDARVASRRSGAMLRLAWCLVSCLVGAGPFFIAHSRTAFGFLFFSFVASVAIIQENWPAKKL